MLSFDITDRNIRVIKGTETGGGKIRIQSSTDIRIEEGLIANGYIKDIAQMATIINSGLKQKGIKDKDAVVSISSNLIVFKELYIPKGKASQLKTAVQMEMQKSISVTDEQAIAYTVVGDVEKDGKTTSKVLANAVPKNVVECYRRVFAMLNIQLKSVSVSCNCISRVVLSDPQIMSKMPFLLVQIDPNFININVFESGQLTFSRFASISRDDYDDKSDYVFQAVNENLFRMFQFQRSRSGENIQDVVFYGDTSEFIRLTNSLEQMDVKASLLKIPPMLSGYENLEFSLYANAIGAMYKRPKDDESSNLLTNDTSGSIGKSESSSKQKVEVTGLQLLGNIGVSLLIAVVLIGGAWAVMDFLLIGTQKKEMAKIDAYIEEKQPELLEIDRKNAMLEKLNTYNLKVESAEVGVKSLPVFNSEKWEKIYGCFDGVIPITFVYEEGIIEFEIISDSVTMPSIVASRLVDLDYFDNVTYEEYEVNEDDVFSFIADVAGTGTETEIEQYDPVSKSDITVEVVKSEIPIKAKISVQIRGTLQEDAIKNPKKAAATEETATEGGEV